MTTTPAFYAKHRERLLAERKAYREANREKVNAYTAAYMPGWRAANPDKSARWRKRNPGKISADNARRKADKIRATPPWADLEKIVAVYVEAVRLTQETGIPHHVDHHFPLRARDGSRGLHVHYNLQILPAVANLRKSNVLP